HQPDRLRARAEPVAARPVPARAVARRPAGVGPARRRGAPGVPAVRRGRPAPPPPGARAGRAGPVRRPGVPAPAQGRSGPRLIARPPASPPVPTDPRPGTRPLDGGAGRRTLLHVPPGLADGPP